MKALSHGVNPVIRGFHPDPSVIRVGQDYYLVTSTFEYHPGLPVYHSRDLVNWRLLAHAATRRGQLVRPGATYDGFSLYAPTIRHHADIFYIACTNVWPGNGNFIITARDPAGPWSDAVWIEEEHPCFDPSLHFDDDGTVYYARRTLVQDFWKKEGGDIGGIVQAEIDVATGRLLTPLRHISPGDRGFVSNDIEGPHLYHIGDWYYLLSAEGGARVGHMATIARARSPWGPFESCPNNPLLSTRSLSLHPVRHTGHGDLVEDAAGNWWIAFLATRQAHYNDLQPIGRETFLAPVTWVDGWPLVNGGRPVDLAVGGPLPPAQPWPQPPQRDDFTAAERDGRWLAQQLPTGREWSLTARPGFLRLPCLAPTLSDPAPRAFLARRQEELACRVRARIEFAPTEEGAEAGLAVFQRQECHVAVYLERRAGRLAAGWRRRIGSLDIDQPGPLLPDGAVELEIVADPSWYAFALTDAAGTRHELGRIECHYLAAELADVWTGSVFALYATGRGTDRAQHADIDWFEALPGAPA